VQIRTRAFGRCVAVFLHGPFAGALVGRGGQCPFSCPPVNNNKYGSARIHYGFGLFFGLCKGKKPNMARFAKKKKTYEDYTYNSKNPLARLAHRTRFSKATNIVLNLQNQCRREEKNLVLLDYGAGDGHFLHNLSSKNWEGELVGFEPLMSLKFPGDSISFHSDLRQLLDGQFDIITCFEVLEHFNSKGQREILSNINRLLANNGRVVISIPIEMSFPSIVKNLRRRLTLRAIRKPKEYTFYNMWRAFCGKDIPEVRDAEGYLTHIGFDHKKLEQLFTEFFLVESRSYSPFSVLGVSFNSQIFYVLKKK